MIGLNLQKSLFIEVPMLTMTANKKTGRNWKFINKERNQLVNYIGLKYRSLIPLRPFKRAKLHYYRHSSTCPDFDGMVDSCKKLQDALVKLGFIQDDSMKHIWKPEYDWVQAKLGEGKMQVVIQQLPDDTVFL